MLTTTILEGWQSVMIISATFLKPRERRIREEAREEGRAEGIKEGMERGSARTAQVEERLELERAAWQAWYERSELARAKGEEPPPPPFFGRSNGHSG